MSKEDALDDEDSLSLGEASEWMMNEIHQITRAAELRIKEVVRLVTAYKAGEISAEEATERICKYGQRWGEAIPGILSAKGMADEEVLAYMDEARDPNFVKGLLAQWDKKKRDEPARG